MTELFCAKTIVQFETNRPPSIKSMSLMDRIDLDQVCSFFFIEKIE